MRGKYRRLFVDGRSIRVLEVVLIVDLRNMCVDDARGGFVVAADGMSYLDVDRNQCGRRALGLCARVAPLVSALRGGVWPIPRGLGARWLAACMWWQPHTRFRVPSAFTHTRQPVADAR